MRMAYPVLVRAPLPYNLLDKARLVKPVIHPGGSGFLASCKAGPAWDISFGDLPREIFGLRRNLASLNASNEKSCF